MWKVRIYGGWGVSGMFELWKAFLNLWQLYNEIYKDPCNIIKSLESEKETAPEECRQFYDALITLCRLKIIADKRNMTVIELVDEIVKDYVSRHGVIIDDNFRRSKQDSGSDT
jgi:hypothetical protein